MVYYSRALREQFPKIVDTLNNHLLCQEIDSSNLWIRDYFPIKTGDSFTKFKYKGYEKYSWLAVFPECWQFANPQLSDIYLDGGNVVQNEDVVFMTEQVFKNNPTISRLDLKQFLKDRFGKNIIFLPVEPFDDLGHADGIIKFKDNKTVIINDYRSLVSQTWSEYAMKMEKVITDNGFEFIKIPWAYGSRPRLTEKEFRKQYPLADDFNIGYGYYINYYQTKDYIFLPTFGIKQDIEVVKFLRSYVPFQKAIVPVDCSELSMMGGLLNCVVWEN